MSRKTHYKTFTQPDLTELEKEVNNHIRGLYKDEKLDKVKVNDITTFTANNTFVAAVTFSYGKKKELKDLTTSAEDIMKPTRSLNIISTK